MEFGYRFTSMQTDPLTRGMPLVPLRVGVWPSAPRTDGLLIADFLTDARGAAALIDGVQSFSVRCAITLDQDDVGKFVVVEIMGNAPDVEKAVALFEPRFERIVDYHRDHAQWEARVLHLPPEPRARGPK